MKREQRLRRPADFQHVRAHALAPRGWAHPLLVLYAAPNEAGPSRIGVSVGKRVSRSAVARNRVRRRLREAVRLRYDDLAAGYDLLFVARPPSATATWADLRLAVAGLVARANLWRPSE